MEENLNNNILIKEEKKENKKSGFRFILYISIISLLFGLLGGFISFIFFYSYLDFSLENNLDILNISKNIDEKENIIYFSEEEAIIDVVKKYSPAVVSIVVTKDVPIFERYFFGPFGPEISIPENGTTRREIGGGTGFVVSEDGYVVTNKHVVSDTSAIYTIFTIDGKKFDADIIARDPLQDMAVLKIKQEELINEQGKELKKFTTVKLGNSDNLNIGQRVIAIGNALGEFRNTVSTGVISGLGRRIIASGGGVMETLEDVIQTDAAINRGNSGGPLLNLNGEVIGINTAMASGAQSIGFAIPVNNIKKAIDQVKNVGKIVYPFLGVRYILINEDIKKENNLPVDYGVWVRKGDNGESAIFPNSPAQNFGILENDIILEFNNEKITSENPLAKIISKYDPGDKIFLKILRKETELIVDIILGEREDF